MLDDLLVLYAVQIDVDAGVSLMRSLGDQEHEVALSQQEVDRIDGPMLHQDLHVAHELGYPVAHPGFVPDHQIAGEVLLALTVVARDMKGFVISAHE